LRLYLDTSLIVALLVGEEASLRARKWLRGHEKEDLLISWWVETEVVSSLSRKVRMADIDIADRDRGIAAFRRFASDSLFLLEVDRGHFQTAEQFCLQAASGIRAADALHMAISFEHGATLCTLDRRLGAVGPNLGVETVLI
jgi:uncharacterized protein